MAREKTPSEIVQAYFDRGFHPVFWEPHGDVKGPEDKGWPKKHYSFKDYNESNRVGLLLGTEVSQGRFLHDFDLDWKDGAAIVVALLPATGFAVSRAGKPLSHLFYLLPDAHPIRQYRDIDTIDAKGKKIAGRMLFEFRGVKTDGTVGLQTMVPPSVWTKEGVQELLNLKSFDEPLYLESSHEMFQNLSLVAIGMLLALHLGKNGFGHEPRLCWAGFLLRAGVAQDALIKMGEAISSITNNREVTDVRRVVESTALNIQRNRKVKGGPSLAKCIGDQGKAVITRINELLGNSDPITETIDRLNDRFAIISLGNKVVVMENLPDGSIQGLWPFEEFRKLLIKDRVEKTIMGADNKVTIKNVESSQLWLTHQDGRRYDRLVYSMAGSVENCGDQDYNGWLGFTVLPTHGDWHLNREHLLRIICSGNQLLFDWIFNWLAALVQFPGRHAFTAIVLRGGEGIGKGHFAHLMVGSLFNKQQYLHIIGAGMLTSQFNEHLSGKVFVFADESTWGGDPRAADKLKGMVTEGTVPIERKFLPLVEEPSMLHIMIASNNDWPIAIPIDDRRFVVLDVAETHRQMDSYFTPLRQELNDGGLAAMLADLLEHRIDESALRHPPSTEAKREVMMQSLKSIERWWYEKLLNGEVIDGEDWPVKISKAVLHTDYLVFLEKHKDHRVRHSTETELGMFLSKYTRTSERRETNQDGSRERVWVLPSLDDCRSYWLEKCGWTTEFLWSSPPAIGLVQPHDVEL